MTSPRAMTAAVGRAQVDRVAGVERALDPGDPGRQQRLAPHRHGRDRAVVEQQPAPGRRGVRQPELARGPRRRRRARTRCRRRRRPAPRRRLAAEVSRVGMPAAAAMPAASTLVTIPPVPTRRPGAADRHGVEVLGRRDQRHAPTCPPGRAGRRTGRRRRRAAPGRPRAPDVGDQRRQPVVVPEPDLVRWRRCRSR